MNYYQILPEKKLPIDILTYKSKNEYNIGQIVYIDIRGKKYFGVILSKNTNLSGDLDDYKEISNIYPYILPDNTIEFIKNFANNTFNNPSSIFESVMIPIKLINQKNKKNLSESIYEGQKLIDIIKEQNKLISKEQGESKQPKIDFILDSEVFIRIRDIIRISISGIQKPRYNSYKQDYNILVIFPEKKLLDGFYKKHHSDFKNKEFLEPNLYIYKAERRKSDQTTVLKLIQGHPIFDYTNQDFERGINIILSTKSGVFLPFNKLDQIITVDESNSFYIQDQNSLYYDSRDIAFLLSSSHKCNLTFISSLPSIRLSNFYSETFLDEISNSYQQNNTKLPKIQINSKNYKNDEFKVISNQILSIIKNDQDINQIFSNEDEQQ